MLKKEKIIEIWDSVRSCKKAISGREKYSRNMSFYHGKNNSQWTSDAVSRIRKMGFYPYTDNVSKYCIDNISGREIQNRFVPIVTTHSAHPKKQALAGALTSLLLYIESINDAAHVQSLAFRDALIHGVGWMEFDHITQDPDWNSLASYQDRYKIKYVPSFYVINDPTDLSIDISESKYIFRVYPSNDFLQNQISSDYSVTSSSEYFNSRVEIQYKKLEEAYYGIDSNGHKFKTFEKEKAFDLSKSNVKVFLKKELRTYRAKFFSSTKEFIKHEPIDWISPGSTDFGYVPIVWDRAFAPMSITMSTSDELIIQSGTPLGLMDSIIDLQRSLNEVFTKIQCQLSARQFLVTSDIIDGQNFDKIVDDLSDRNSIVMMPKGASIDNISQNDDLSKMIGVYNQLKASIFASAGLNHELLGQQSNASSAVAQNFRAINAQNNNISGFDKFSLARKKLARLVVNSLQREQNIELSSIVSEDEMQALIEHNIFSLNVRGTDNESGELVILNDVSTIPFSIDIDESVYAQSNNEFMHARLMQGLQYGISLDFFRNPDFAALMLGGKGVHLAKILGSLFAQKQQETQPQVPQQNGMPEQ